MPVSLPPLYAFRHTNRSMFLIQARPEYVVTGELGETKQMRALNSIVQYPPLGWS
jgi:hypothetical protein